MIKYLIKRIFNTIWYNKVKIIFILIALVLLFLMGKCTYIHNYEPIIYVSSISCSVTFIELGRSDHSARLHAICGNTSYEVYGDIASTYVNKLNQTEHKPNLIGKIYHHEWRNFNQIFFSIEE